MAVVAFLTAVLALLASISAHRRLLATQAELASVNAALDRERHATAESIADVHRSTVEEVATLLENVLAQVDTEITANVAEALALLSPARDQASITASQERPSMNPQHQELETHPG
jgi:formate dehydrogenase maturation protein FdhE